MAVFRPHELKNKCATASLTTNKIGGATQTKGMCAVCHCCLCVLFAVPVCVLCCWVPDVLWSWDWGQMTEPAEGPLGNLSCNNFLGEGRVKILGSPRPKVQFIRRTPGEAPCPRGRRRRPSPPRPAACGPSPQTPRLSLPSAAMSDHCPYF